MSSISASIAPIWLRPAAIAAVVCAHALVLLDASWPTDEGRAVMAPLAVQVVPQGREATAVEAPREAQVAEVTAVQAVPSDAQPVQAREATPEHTAAILPVPNIATIDPRAEVVTATDVPEPPVKPARPEKKMKPHRKPSEATAARSKASALARQAMANAVTGGEAGATYRSIVAAELNRRKFYPPAARASGVEGVVTVTFTVGASGHVTGHAITRSSGQPALDQAVHQMMAAISLPPPPGGVFRATVPIRFDLAH
jgi:protein TonB